MLVTFLSEICSGQVIVKNLRCENRINPLGIDMLNPRFSWQLVSDHRNILQTAYEIRVSDQSGNVNFWNSGKQDGFAVPFCSLWGYCTQICDYLLLAGQGLG